MKLKNESHMPAPILVKLMFVQVVQDIVPHPDGTRIGPVESSDDIKQGAFPATASPVIATLTPEGTVKDTERRIERVSDPDR